MRKVEHERWGGLGYVLAFGSGVVVGGLLGGGAMLLLAPKSGREMRSQIQQEGRTLRDEAAHSVELVVEQARGTAHGISERVRREAEHLAPHEK